MRGRQEYTSRHNFLPSSHMQRRVVCLVLVQTHPSHHHHHRRRHYATWTNKLYFSPTTLHRPLIVPFLQPIAGKVSKCSLNLSREAEPGNGTAKRSVICTAPHDYLIISTRLCTFVVFVTLSSLEYRIFIEFELSTMERDINIRVLNSRRSSTIAKLFVGLIDRENGSEFSEFALVSDISL